MADVSRKATPGRECGPGADDESGEAVTEGEGRPLPPETGPSALPVRKGAAGKPGLPCRRSGAAESGWVGEDNRHLNDLAESIDMNAGGCPETEPSRPGGETGQRRSRRSSRRPGEPATGRRA